MLRRVSGQDLAQSSRSDPFWTILTRLAVVLSIVKVGTALPQTIADALPPGEEWPRAEIAEANPDDQSYRIPNSRRSEGFTRSCITPTPAQLTCGSGVRTGV